MGIDTRDLELFLCPGAGTPTAAPAVCTGTEPNGSTANDQNIVFGRAEVAKAPGPYPRATAPGRAGLKARQRVTAAQKE
jgi:hypothetical protein